MTTLELEQQKVIIKVYNELQEEIEANYKNTNALGWQQRNELITHVLSDYNNHEKLNAKRNEWMSEIKRSRVLIWTNKLLNNNRDIYGYFDLAFIISEIKDLKKASIKLEKYEITMEIDYWLKKISVN